MPILYNSESDRIRIKNQLALTADYLARKTEFEQGKIMSPPKGMTESSYLDIKDGFGQLPLTDYSLVVLNASYNPNPHPLIPIIVYSYTLNNTIGIGWQHAGGPPANTWTITITPV